MLSFTVAIKPSDAALDVNVLKEETNSYIKSENYTLTDGNFSLFINNKSISSMTGKYFLLLQIINLKKSLDFGTPAPGSFRNPRGKLFG